LLVYHRLQGRQADSIHPEMSCPLYITVLTVPTVVKHSAVRWMSPSPKANLKDNYCCVWFQYSVQALPPVIGLCQARAVSDMVDKGVSPWGESTKGCGTRTEACVGNNNGTGKLYINMQVRRKCWSLINLFT